MVTPDFLAKLGLFVKKNFLDAETCNELRGSALTAQGKPATITQGDQDILDPYTRKTNQIPLSPEMEHEMVARLLAIKPELEKHFRVTLSGCQGAKLLAYSVGDYFRPHADTVDSDDYPQAIKKRQVSVSILLNNADQEEKPLTYSGGALTFYNLLHDPRLKLRGFPLQGEEGLLIAFSSRIVHEVQPITRGERYSLVTWFI